jgi:serine protease Do
MKEPGANVEIVIVREGKRKPLTATLDKRPSKEAMEAAKGGAAEKLGIAVQNLTEETAKRFGYEDLKGVIVTAVEPDSPAASAGIQPGSLIQQVNRKPVENTKQFNEEVQKAVKEGRISLLLRFENSSMFLVLPLPKD